MNIQEELRISGYQPVVGFATTETREILKHWIEQYGKNNIYIICSHAYNLGKVHGKREERARRKKQKVLEELQPKEELLDLQIERILQLCSRLDSEALKFVEEVAVRL